MSWLRNHLKKIKPLRKLYYKILEFTPQKIYFNRNLKKVEQFDNVNGTNFSGRMYWDEIGTTVERANDYSPTPDKLIETLEKFHISAKDAILDLGSGKGYAMYLMSKYGFGKIGGVELSELLCDIAKDNLDKMMPKGLNWEVINCDAGKWDGYEKYNYFFMYNPFPREVLIEVKRRIEESIIERPRKVTLLYLMPRCAEVFSEDENWRLVRRGSIFEQKRGMHIFVNV